MGTVVVINGQALTPEQVVEVAHGARVVLGGDARKRMSASAAAFAAQPSIVRAKRRALVGADPRAGETDGEGELERFILDHCAGVGDPLPDDVTRALMVCRANVLAVGPSGARPEAAEALIALLNAGITPVVPSQGSVGAAGDLAPLAHVARVLCGWGGLARRADGTVGEGLPDGHPAFVPTPKEALSLINGATLTSALAAVAVERAQRVLEALEVACAMTMEALRADRRCLSIAAIDARNHVGAVRVAARLGRLLEGSTAVVAGNPPDAFSVRAAPAVIGALHDTLAHVRGVVLDELNGACDNPLWFEGEGFVEAGNFHGAPVAVALDALRIAVTQAITQSERRTSRLSTGDLTHDLPSFLVEGTGLNSGFMLAQYTAASLVSACKGLAHPASVDTIPTVQHHEDHVSMGPIAGRMTLLTLEHAADVVAIEALLAAQALDFRREGVSWRGRERQSVPPQVLPPGVARAHGVVRGVTARWLDDQVLHPDLVAVGRLVRAGALSGGPRAGWDGWNAR